MCQPRQNRVTPFGDIVAIPQRGGFMGNRGILHDENGQLGRRRWMHKAWITCVLQFKSRQRQIMAPRRYTELFFLDEAVAYAAGHRPCAECRRQEYTKFKQAMVQVCPALGPNPKAAEIDKMLHGHRRDSAGRQVTYLADVADLPVGTFFCQREGQAVLKSSHGLLTWGAECYHPVTFEITKPVHVLTPRPVVDALKNGLIYAHGLST